MSDLTIEARVAELVRQYAQAAPAPGPLDPALSLRDELAIESLALVSLVVRLGDELGVDVADEGLEIDGVLTVGDLLALGRRIASRRAA